MKGPRVLNACPCSIRKLYKLLALEMKALKKEQCKWYPDNSVQCPSGIKDSVIRKASELYAEIGNIISGRITP